MAPGFLVVVWLPLYRHLIEVRRRSGLPCSAPQPLHLNGNTSITQFAMCFFYRHPQRGRTAQRRLLRFRCLIPLASVGGTTRWTCPTPIAHWAGENQNPFSVIVERLCRALEVQCLIPPTWTETEMSRTMSWLTAVNVERAPRIFF